MKHIVFCGVRGSGKSFQARRLMKILFQEEEWHEVEDNKNINLSYVIKKRNAAIIDGCRSVERIAWLSGQIDAYAAELGKTFNAVFTTPDVEGAALLDKKMFRAIECIDVNGDEKTFAIKQLNFI